MAPSPSDDTTLKARSAKHLLLSSPPGQFDSILSDLRTILSDRDVESILAPDFVDDVRSEYESRTNRRVLLESSSSSPRPAPSSSDDDDDDPRSAALRKAMERYVAENYSSRGGARSAATVEKVTTAGGAEEEEEEGGSCARYRIATYAERVDLRNRHAGSWTAVWSVRADASSGKASSLEGTVKIVAHAFEGGNVQLRSAQRFGPASLEAGSSPEDLARSVADQISSWEGHANENPWEGRGGGSEGDEGPALSALGSLSDMYEGMSDGMLKQLRRVMPVTRTRMDWNLAGHRMVQNLGGSSGK